MSQLGPKPTNAEPVVTSAFEGRADFRLDAANVCNDPNRTSATTKDFAGPPSRTFQISQVECTLPASDRRVG
jgi:hypothetical protein